MNNSPSSPCHICGQTSFSWGRVAAQYKVKYQADDASMLEKLGGAIYFGDPVKARKCDECGNLQLFVAEE